SKADYLLFKSGQIVDIDGNITFDRYQRWADILHVFDKQNSYLFGIGTGDVQALYNQAYVYGSHKTAYFNSYNAHNQYIEFFVAMGVVGFLYYLFVLGYWIKATQLKGIALAVLLIIALFSISESIFKRSQGVFIFAYFYSVTVLIYNEKRNRSNNPFFLNEK